MPGFSPFTLPEPPDSPTRGAPFPVTNPPLVDQEPPDWQEDIEQWRPFASEPIDPEVTADEAEQSAHAALDDGRVREFLGDGRVTDHGASAAGDKGDGQPALLRHRFFSCDTLRGVDVVIDRATMTVLEVTSPDGQPPPLPEEIDLAVALAAERLGVDPADLVGRAIFVTRENSGDPLYRHRLAEVRFGRPDERLPRRYALVDVCAELVLDAGDM